MGKKLELCIGLWKTIELLRYFLGRLTLEESVVSNILEKHDIFQGRLWYHMGNIHMETDSLRLQDRKRFVSKFSSTAGNISETLNP